VSNAFIRRGKPRPSANRHERQRGATGSCRRSGLMVEPGSQIGTRCHQPAPTGTGRYSVVQAHQSGICRGLGRTPAVRAGGLLPGTASARPPGHRSSRLGSGGAADARRARSAEPWRDPTAVEAEAPDAGEPVLPSGAWPPTVDQKRDRSSEADYLSPRLGCPRTCPPRDMMRTCGNSIRGCWSKCAPGDYRCRSRYGTNIGGFHLRTSARDAHAPL
jgi:hypothetical protein